MAPSQLIITFLWRRVVRNKGRELSRRIIIWPFEERVGEDEKEERRKGTEGEGAVKGRRVADTR